MTYVSLLVFSYQLQLLGLNQWSTERRKSPRVKKPCHSRIHGGKIDVVLARGVQLMKIIILNEVNA